MLLRINHINYELEVSDKDIPLDWIMKTIKTTLQEYDEFNTTAWDDAFGELETKYKIELITNILDTLGIEHTILKNEAREGLVI